MSLAAHALALAAALLLVRAVPPTIEPREQAIDMVFEGPSSLPRAETDPGSAKLAAATTRATPAPQPDLTALEQPTVEPALSQPEYRPLPTELTHEPEPAPEAVQPAPVEAGQHPEIKPSETPYGASPEPTQTNTPSIPAKPHKTARKSASAIPSPPVRPSASAQQAAPSSSASSHTESSAVSGRQQQSQDGQPPAALPDGNWMRALSAWLATHKTYPDAARRRGEEGRLAIRFTVDRSGRVSDVQVVRSSGSSLLDEAAHRMLHDATVPALPPAISQPSLTITVPIRYALTP